MKKVFPILEYLDDDDFIIYTDDDVLVPRNLIASRLKDYEKHKQAITGRRVIDYNHAIYNTFGVVEQSSTVLSLVTKRMLNNYQLLLTDEIIEKSNDDMIYTILVILNGFHFVCCSDYAAWADKHIGSKNKVRFWHDNNGLQRS